MLDFTAGWTQGLFLTQCRHSHLTETKGAFLGACINRLLWQIVVVKVKIFQTTFKFTALNVKHPSPFLLSSKYNRKVCEFENLLIQDT